MNTWMLNLVFNWNTTNGLFLPYTPGTDPLMLSMAWLKAKTTSPGYDNSADWELQAPDSQRLIVSANDTVWVRFQGTNLPNSSGKTPQQCGCKGRVTVLVALGSPPTNVNAPPPASPFVLAGSNGACTVFDTTAPGDKGPPIVFPSPAYSWLAPLGVVPNNSALNDCQYSLITGATICYPNSSGWGLIQTYSHDPDMEVDI